MRNTNKLQISWPAVGFIAYKVNCGGLQHTYGREFYEYLNIKSGNLNKSSQNQPGSKWSLQFNFQKNGPKFSDWYYQTEVCFSYTTLNSRWAWTWEQKKCPYLLSFRACIGCDLVTCMIPESWIQNFLILDKPQSMLQYWTNQNSFKLNFEGQASIVRMQIRELTRPGQGLSLVEPFPQPLGHWNPVLRCLQNTQYVQEADLSGHLN